MYDDSQEEYQWKHDPRKRIIDIKSRCFDLKNMSYRELTQDEEKEIDALYKRLEQESSVK